MKRMLWLSVVLCAAVTACGPSAPDSVALTAKIAAPTDPLDPMDGRQNPANCVSQCDNRSCGDDGCGGVCGVCDNGTICQSNWSCGVPQCTPNCEGRSCGEDGCGTLCGTCTYGLGCIDGVCTASCVPICGDRECGDDGCGGSCGMCANGESCSGNGICAVPCVAQCANKTCGDNGCGGTCGTCLVDESCSDDGQCVADPTACVPNCTDKACGDDGCGGVCGHCSASKQCTADGLCVDLGCSQDLDCSEGTWCNTTNGECIVLSLEQYWAPAITVQTQPTQPYEDFFTTVDYDGDWDATNNANNTADAAQPSAIYSAIVGTQTHWFITYFMYFPRRYAVTLPHDYENAFRSVLLVIRKDGSYGQLELMQTASERFFHWLLPENSPLSGPTGATAGTILWSQEGTHPRPHVFVRSGSHQVLGDAGFENAASYNANWNFGQANHTDLTTDRSYSLVPLVTSLWPQRMNTGTLFSQFGQLARDEASADAPESLAPWAMHDWLDTHQAWGSMLYDPCTLITHKFPTGWDTFSTEYSTNPFAVRVDLHSLTILADTDQLGAGTSDPYIRLSMVDGYGYNRVVLDSIDMNALQFSWQQSNVPVQTTLNLSTSMERTWFYGMEYPGHDLFLLEVRDLDYEYADDWLMAEPKAWCGTNTGEESLDFTLSQVTLTTTIPEEPESNP